MWPAQVEILRPPTDDQASRRGAEYGYDLLYPVRPGEEETWIKKISTIYLRGVPRFLRREGRVWLKAGSRVFFSAPVLDVLSDSDRVSWLTGAQHGEGPSLIVDLDRGKRHNINATKMSTPDGTSWHNRRGFKYVTPSCRAFVKLGPKRPSGAGWARSSIEVAIERALEEHLGVDRGARRLRILDGRPRPVVEVDICIPDRGLVIEFDGWYWHKDSAVRDNGKTNRLIEAGLTVLRIRDNLDPIAAGSSVVLTGRLGSPDDIARAVLDQL